MNENYEFPLAELKEKLESLENIPFQIGKFTYKIETEHAENNLYLAVRVLKLVDSRWVIPKLTKKEHRDIVAKWIKKNY